MTTAGELDRYGGHRKREVKERQTL
ncbi:uncharacterized protein G2W53_001526 [Senna tora]|uniref:Uncharacterized protein n=1 Tax=Senna tora TaxID=362788 RepID=A0A835CKE1_9FABA|nr:uncharacterized protein G2W53_001526 [Senna tora]